MRVLIEAYACDPKGGSENGNGWRLASTLAGQGHNIAIVTTPRFTDNIQQTLQELTESDADISSRLQVWFVDTPQWVEKLPHVCAVYARYQSWLRRVPERIRDQVQEFQPDIVHHQTWGSVQGGTQLWRLGYPTTLGPAGGGQVSPNGALTYLQGGRVTEVIRTTIATMSSWPGLRPRYLKHVSGVIVSNQETADYVNKSGGTVLAQLPDAALPLEFRPAAAPQRDFTAERMQVVWLARLLPRKAVLLAVEAMERLPADSPIELIIVGDGQQGVLLKQRLDNSSAAKRIRWLGKVPWEQVKECYRNADLFLFTSLRDSCAAQLFEAQCWGLPIIAMNLTAARDHLDPASVRLIDYAPKTAAEELAQLMEALRQDPAQRQTMSEAAWRASERHLWPHLAESIMTTLRTVVEKK